MPIFRLTEDVIFPPVHLTSESGILAVGGDLSPLRLLEAYRQGIFPWYSESSPICWWCPDPRFVLFLDELKVSRSMRKVMRRQIFRITYDTSFEKVIQCCRKPRKKQKGTWITDEMVEAYCLLHSLGYAHSVETWYGEKLVGGMYGVSIGRCFFGESMFSFMDNASKAALIHLVNTLKTLDFRFLDCQVYTAHMERMGARLIPRDDFLALLREGLRYDTLRGSWEELAKS